MQWFRPVLCIVLTGTASWRTSACGIKLSVLSPDTQWSVSIVNPGRINPEGDCRGFMADTPVQYAVGMDHLLDRIPYQTAKNIKQRLLSTYGKNKFYQFKRRERLFSPEDQRYIRQVFLSNGVEEEPAFDSWQTGYQWTKG